MRRLSFAALLALIACNPGITPNQTAPARNESRARSAAPANKTAAVPANVAEETIVTPPQPPGVAGMSPYRRREYERGYRDCMSGNFDGERQGESYRIGCMAAEDVKQRR